MSARPRLVLLFGGRSSEHDISVRSATEVAAAVDRSVWDLVLVAIARDGRFLVGRADFGPGEVLRSGEPLADLRSLSPDVVFPLLHGPYGEDGRVQGHLETLAIAYVGCGVLASALCMDKAAFKAAAKSHGLPVLPAEIVTRGRYERQRDEVLAAAATVGLPCFVKPACMGSSLGISRVAERAELPPAIELALRYDDKVLIERGLQRPREIELAVLGNAGEDLLVSAPGEIVLPPGEWYSYDNKYANSVASLSIPATLDESTRARLQAIARTAYEAFDCAGLSRIDFLVDRETDEVWLNEFNTMPGFTSISMYPKLIEHAGIPYPRLIDRLCALGRERHRPG